MLKRLCLLLCAAVLVGALVACGESEDKKSEDKPQGAKALELTQTFGKQYTGRDISFSFKFQYPAEWTLYEEIGNTVYLYTVPSAVRATGHWSTKTEAIARLKTESCAVEGYTYTWVAYSSPGDAGPVYALCLTHDATGDSFFAVPGEPLQPVTPFETGEDFDEEGIPETFEEYHRLSKGESIAMLGDETLVETFDEGESPIIFQGGTRAAASQPQYLYDAETDTIADQCNGTLYSADDERRSFVSADGEKLAGYWIPIPDQIGLTIYYGRDERHLITDPADYLSTRLPEAGQSDPVTYKVGEWDAVRITITNESDAAIGILIVNDQDFYVLIMAFMTPEDIEQYESTVQAIAASAQFSIEDKPSQQ
ncbi:MAG: hypothetical protein GXY36_20040 [Chloroflexi bacterium]|nr:hypothetical protein [Chloroflexota bacterium]